MSLTASHPSATRFPWIVRENSLPRRAAIALAASAFVALCAHISVPLPFTAVPLTLQPFAVIVVGLLLSPIDSFAAMALYLIEGASGLPVFTPSGPGGLLQLFGPSGGFLLSYPLVSAVAGTVLRLLSGLKNKFSAAIIAGAAACALLYIAGAAWFAMLLHADLHTVWISAVAPFLPGEIVKVLAAAGITTALTSRRG